MIKLIAVDMDGTFLNDLGKPDPNFTKILEELIKRNILFTPASGRQLRKLKEMFWNYRDNMAFIGENGGILEYKGDILNKKALDRGLIFKVIEKVSTISGCDVAVCGAKAAYHINSSTDFMDELNKYYYNIVKLTDFDQIEEDILKLGIYDRLDPIKNSYPILNEEFSGLLELAVAGKTSLDIFPLSSNKGQALKVLQEHLNITKEETMVFGDFYNDIEMFSLAHYSYAMENANDYIKSMANFVAPSNNDYGVSRIISEILKIN